MSISTLTVKKVSQSLKRELEKQKCDIINSTTLFQLKKTLKVGDLRDFNRGYQ